MGQIDVDLVDPTVFDLRCNVGDGCLEEPRITPVLIEICRQQDGLGGQCRRLHERHTGPNAERTRFIGCRGHDTPPGVLA